MAQRGAVQFTQRISPEAESRQPSAHHSAARDTGMGLKQGDSCTWQLIAFAKDHGLVVKKRFVQLWF